MSSLSIPPITSQAIDILHLFSLAHHVQAGAIVLFSGEVRNHHHGQEVELLEYEAQEKMAELSILSIVEDAKKKWPLHVALAQHRIGKVTLSECAVVVITSASHRKEAYEANQYIIERIKQETPIWKKEYFRNGDSSWQ